MIRNALLALTTLVLLALNWYLRVDPTRRNLEVLPDMAHSIAYDSYSANPNFRDHKTLREPVPGTIIRGYMPLHYTAAKEDAVRAGIELVSDVRGNRNALARGAIVYATYCETCHGPAGKGDGIVAKRGFPAPPSMLAPRAMGLKDGQIFHIITYGQANMPSYASQIERADRWNVIEYIRKLQGARR